MVRFQPPSRVAHDLDDDNSSSDSGSDVDVTSRARASASVKHANNPQQQHQPHSKSKSNQHAEDDEEDDEDEEEEDDIPLPLRGRVSTHPASSTGAMEDEYGADKNDAEGGTEPTMEDQDEFTADEEGEFLPNEDELGDEYDMKYQSGHGLSSNWIRGDVDAARISRSEAALMDEEEEMIARIAAGDQLDVDEQEDGATDNGHFMPSSLRNRISKSAPRPSPLQSFLRSLPPYQPPQALQQFQPNNPLITKTASPSTRSVLEFHRHSFRAGWNATGTSLFFASGISGGAVFQMSLDPMAVDAAVYGQDVSDIPALTAERVDTTEKKDLIRRTLEGHLDFHSTAAPSSATVFGSASHNDHATNSNNPFSFGAASTSVTSSHLTSFTRLCDMYLDVSKPPAFGASRSRPTEKQVDIIQSTFRLLKVLFSKEEAETRAPKISSGMQALLRKDVGDRNVDLSVLTAQQDSYALSVGREAAFEQGWLQPSVTAAYVVNHIKELQRDASNEVGSDGLRGTQLQQILTYLIGHDLFAATELALSAGYFRLATLLSQLDSSSYTGLIESPDQPPLLQLSQNDVEHQLAMWKSTGMHAYIPQQVNGIFKLMSGDVLIDPSLDWITQLGLRYWYSQPKNSESNLHRALMNYKKHALIQAKDMVRAPFPPYTSYVTRAQRGGKSLSSGVLDGNAEADEMTDGSSQALVPFGGQSNSSDYYDLRFGLLDLYTGQASGLAPVLSPQTHTPHVLDHHLAWHIYSALQHTNLYNQLASSHLSALHMNYVHQLESLSSDHAVDDDFWKWSIYVLLSSPFSRGSAAQQSFDREAIIKHILLLHIGYNRSQPFMLPVPSALAVPSTIPLFKMSSSNFHSVSIAQNLSELSTLPTEHASVQTEEFLLRRCNIHVAWLYEAKAIRSALDREWSVACFYHIHCGNVVEAYSLFESHLAAPWILAIVQDDNKDTGVASSSSPTAVSTLESNLLLLLKYFHSHSFQLHGWNTTGRLWLSFLEFRSTFATNFQHFSAIAKADAAASIRDRNARINQFNSHRKEMEELLRSIQSLETSAAAVVANSEEFHSSQEKAVARLAWSKVSGVILSQLQSFEPLQLALKENSTDSHEATPSESEALIRSADGTVVASDDKLQIINNWRDQFLSQFS